MIWKNTKTVLLFGPCKTITYFMLQKKKKKKWFKYRKIILKGIQLLNDLTRNDEMRDVNKRNPGFDGDGFSALGGWRRLLSLIIRTTVLIIIAKIAHTSLSCGCCSLFKHFRILISHLTNQLTSSMRMRKNKTNNLMLIQLATFAANLCGKRSFDSHFKNAIHIIHSG